MKPNKEIRIERDNLRDCYKHWNHMDKKGLENLKDEPSNEDKREVSDGLTKEVNALYKIRDACDGLISALDGEQPSVSWD